MSKKFTPTVGVEIIIEKDGMILLGKRKNAAGEGLYGLPGGHVEPGETVIQTAIRELQEETGLKVQPDDLELIVVADAPDSEYPYLHIAFKLMSYEGEPKLCEPEKCEGWEWKDPNNIDGEFFGHENILKTYRSGKLYLK